MDATISADIVAILEDAYSTFGVAATYAGVSVTMRAVSSGHRSEHTPSIVLSDRSMKVRRSEVTRPVSGDVVVIEGTSYIVTDEPSGTPWEWTVDLAEAAA